MRLALRLVAIALAFAVLALPLSLVGDLRSSEMRRLEKLRAVPGARPLDFAIIGDSRPHAGLSPTEIASTLATEGLPGLSGHNFGVDGTDVLNHYSFTTNGLLALPEAPRLVLWAVNPAEFDGSSTNSRLEQLVPSDVPMLYELGAPTEMLLDVFTMRFFPPWRHRPALALRLADFTERAEELTRPFQTRVLGLRVKPPSRRLVPLPDGHEPIEVVDWQDRFERRALRYVGEYQALIVSPWQCEVGRRLAHRLRAAGVQLILLELPVSPWYQQHLTTTPKHQEWRRRMRDLAGEEHAQFWDHSTLYTGAGDDHRFADPGHMDRATAFDYSRRLGRMLAENGDVVAALSAGRGADRTPR